MRFDIPTPEMYAPRPPSVSWWMHKGFCPILEEALNPRHIEPMLSELKKINVDKRDIGCSVSPVIRRVFLEWNMTVKGRRLFAPSRTMHGDLLGNDKVGVIIEYFWVNNGDLWWQYQNGVYCSITAELGRDTYLLPYMFKTVLLEPHKIPIIVDVPAHWERLKDLGLLPEGLYSHCAYALSNV